MHPLPAVPMEASRGGQILWLKSFVWGCWKLDLGLLEEQMGLLATKAFLQLLKKTFVISSKLQFLSELELQSHQTLRGVSR